MTSKRFPSWVFTIYLKDWDSISEIFAVKESNPLGLVTKQSPRSKPSQACFSLSSANPVLITPTQPFVGYREYFLIVCTNFQNGQQSMNFSLQLKKGTLKPSITYFIQAEKYWHWNWFGKLPSIVTVGNSKDLGTFSMLYFAWSLNYFDLDWSSPAIGKRFSGLIINLIMQIVEQHLNYLIICIMFLVCGWKKLT